MRALTKPSQDEKGKLQGTARERHLATKQRAVPRLALPAEAPTVPGPASIVELARALRNNVDLIYEWVYSNVDFYCQIDTSKGALGTLIDRVAGPFDQAALMVNLCRQAGYTANYVVGSIRITAAQLANLLGTTDTTTQYPSLDVLEAGNLYNTPVFDEPGNLLYVDLHEGDFASYCWVQVNIDGTDYVFDPSFKSYNRTTTSFDFATITGFDSSVLQTNAQAGTTFADDGSWLKKLNTDTYEGTDGVRPLFSSYASSLLSWLQSDHFDASMDDIIGGTEILPQLGPNRQTSLPYQTPDFDVTVYSELPDDYRKFFNIVFGGFAAYDLYIDQYYGSRITISFTPSGENVIPVLMADGNVLATGTAQTPNTTLIAEFSALAQTWLANIYTDPDSLYFFGFTCGPVSQSMVDYHKQIMLQNIANGQTSTDEDVLGESLATLFFSYSAQHFKLEEIFAQLGSVYFNWSLDAGIMGYNSLYQGPYSDLVNILKTTSLIGDFNGSYDVWIPAQFMLGAFEAGIQQQTFGGTGISTPRVLDVANTAEQKIFAASRFNWTTGDAPVEPQLVNWSAWTSYIGDILTAVPQEVIINQDGATSIGIFSGGAWIQARFALPALGFIITPPAGGGVSSQPVDKNKMSKDTGKLPDTTQPENGSCCKCCDPVQLFSGSFLYERNDMTVGSGTYPYALSFSRHYDSSARLEDGPLGLGWSHNLTTTISAGSNGLRGCGEISPKEAAAAIATAYALINLGLYSESYPNLFLSLIASTASLWLIDQITNNSVVMTNGDSSQAFIKLVDGTYNPPPNSADVLAQNEDSTYTVTSPQQLKWNFNIDGNVDTYVDPAGVTVAYTYTSGMLTGVTNCLGRTLTLAYTDERLTSVSDGNDRSILFSIDENKNLISFTDANGKNITYHYEMPGQLSKVFLPANPITPYVTNTFDTLGRISTQTVANNGTQHFYFAGSRSEVVDALGNSHVMYNNNLGVVLKDINALGQETLNEVDGLNRIILTTSPELNQVQTTYDNFNNVLTTTMLPKPGSSLSNIVLISTFDPTWNKVATFKDGEGNETSFAYDSSQGTLLSITRPTIGGMTPVINFTYNSRGQLLTRTDETGIVDNFVYASSGALDRLLSSTHDFGTGRLNLETQFGYDTAGNINSVTDPRGNTTAFIFDNERRLTQRQECTPFDFITNFYYDDNGNQTSIQRQTGDIAHPYQIYSFGYLANNTLATTTDPLGYQTNFVYNANNWLIKKIDAENRTWQYSFDPLGRISIATDPLGNASQTNTYTSNGMLATITDARSNVTTMQYDGFDRLFKTIYPDSTFEEYSYNANNQVLTLLTRLGDTITNTYDVLTRLSTRQPGAVLGLQTMTYDLANRPLQVSTPVISGDPSTGAFQYSYDTAGRLLVQTMPNSDTVTYQLDENGNRTRLIWPDSYYVDYVFDELNRLTDIKLNGSSSSAINFDYDELSRRTTATYINGCVCSYAYALNNDMTSLAQAFVGSSVTFKYGFNTVHQVTSLKVDDPTFMVQPTASTNTSYASANNLNQYPSVDSSSFGYDNNGNLTSGTLPAGALTASFDALNRPTQIVIGSTTNNYWTDPMNRQAQKEIGSTKTGYLYNGNQLIADYDSSHTLQNRYIRSNSTDEALIQITGSTTTFLHQDRIGSTIAQTNDSGTVLNKYTYSPFGITPSLLGTIFGFTGQRYDAEIEIYNYKARYYCVRSAGCNLKV